MRWAHRPHGAGATAGPAARLLRSGSSRSPASWPEGRGWWGCGGWLDSAPLDDAVATQNTVTQLAAAIRRVRLLVPKTREVQVAAHDDDQPAKPACAWDDPQAKQALVSGSVGDALVVLVDWPRSGLACGLRPAR
jgi:hypothetical protein